MDEQGFDGQEEQTYEERDFDIEAFSQMIGGDEKENANVTVYEETPEVEVYKPVITRETMSKFEFVRVITAVGKYLYSRPDISKYCDEIEVNTLINPLELAFDLIMEGKMNATLDRLGYEKVTFSELKINPLWVDMAKNYFKQRKEAEKDELLKPLNLVE